MKCPHCTVTFHDDPKFEYLGKDARQHWGVAIRLCAACKRFILHLQHASEIQTAGSRTVGLISAKGRLIEPKGTTRGPVPAEVPSEVAEDYLEACLVLPDSPKASAALSRRCLQHVLRTAGGIKKGDLASEIQSVLDSKQLPSHIADSVDAIRTTGNFSAHPIKSTATGGIVPVEPHEAEWNLEVLEMLFDFYYVQPAVTKKKRDALNAKLAESGKPPMKQT